jgi:hypothetical protein
MRSNEKVTDVVFKPYFNESLGKMINTRAQEKREIYGTGRVLMGDLPHRLDESKKVRENREDIIHQRYKEMGIHNYPRGKKVTYDEKNHRFIPNSR